MSTQPITYVILMFHGTYSKTELQVQEAQKYFALYRISEWNPNECYTEAEIRIFFISDYISITCSRSILLLQ